MSVTVYAYQQIFVCRTNGRFHRHRNQLVALIQFAYILVDVCGICSRSVSVNRMIIRRTFFMQLMLELTSVRTWKSSLCSRNACASNHFIMCFLDKTYKCLKKTTRKFNYKSKLCQNATLKCSTVVKLNAFEHSINWMLDALSGRKQLRHDLGGQCLSEVTRFIGNPLDIWPWWHDLSPSNFLRHDLWL